MNGARRRPHHNYGCRLLIFLLQSIQFLEETRFGSILVYDNPGKNPILLIFLFSLLESPGWVVALNVIK